MKTKFYFFSLIICFVSQALFAQNQWQSLFGPFKGQINDFVVSPSDPDVINIVTDFGTYRTSNGGVSWSKVSNTAALRIAVSSFDNNVLITSRERSFDGGASWGSLNLIQTNDLEFSPQSNSIVYSISFDNKVQRTNNLGTSWTIVDDSAGFYGTYKKILTCPQNPTLVYVLTDGGYLCKSLDNGNTWSRMRYSLSYHVYVSGAVDPNNENKVYIAASDTIYRSTDGGNTFIKYHNASTNNPWDITVDPSANTLFLISSYAADQKSFYRSIDNGATWTPVFGNKLSCNKIIAVPGGKVFLSTFYAGLLRSEESGENFTSIGYNLIWGKGIKAVSDTVAYVWDDISYYKTTNGGNNWTIIHGTGGFFPDALAINRNDYNKLYICNYESLSISPDGGNNWTNLPASAVGNLNEIWVTPGNDMTIYAKGFNSSTSRYQLGKTTNGGITWSLVTMPVDYPYWALRINPATPDYVYWFPIRAGNNFIYQSTNGGSGWTQIIPPFNVGEFINDFQISATGKLLVGQKSLWQSTDNGANWLQAYHYSSPNPEIYYISLNMVADSVLYTHHPNVNKLFGSKNGGVNWQSAFDNLPFYQFHYSTGVSSGVMVFISTDKGMFRGNPLNLINVGITQLSSVAEDFKLFQNFPNPFNPSTVIRYSLKSGSQVKLSVFDMLGKEVAVLVNEKQNAGMYEAGFDAGALASGVYFYKLEARLNGQAGDIVQTKKMLLIK